MTPENWREMYDHARSWLHKTKRAQDYAAYGESLEQFKRRYVQRMRRAGLVEWQGYWYRADDKGHNRAIAYVNDAGQTELVWGNRLPQRRTYLAKQKGSERKDRREDQISFQGMGARQVKREARKEGLERHAQQRAEEGQAPQGAGWQWRTTSNGRRVAARITRPSTGGRHRA